MALKVKVPTVKCPFCSHEWVARVPEVNRCPRCFKRFEEKKK